MVKPEDVVLGEIDKLMDEVTDRIFQLSQENLLEPHEKTFKSGKTKTIITTDTSNLLRSGNVNRRFLEKEIVYSAPYSSDVHWGNAGFPVKAQDLLKWVRRKVLKGKGTEAQVLRTATNIAKSLSQRGQSPDPFLQKAIFQAKAEFEL